MFVGFQLHPGNYLKHLISVGTWLCFCKCNIGAVKFYWGRETWPEAQFPSAVPPDAVQVSDDWQVPNITVEDFAVDKMVHWLKVQNMLVW